MIYHLQGCYSFGPSMISLNFKTTLFNSRCKLSTFLFYTGDENDKYSLIYFCNITKLVDGIVLRPSESYYVFFPQLVILGEIFK